MQSSLQDLGNRRAEWSRSCHSSAAGTVRLQDPCWVQDLSLCTQSKSLSPHSRDLHCVTAQDPLLNVETTRLWQKQKNTTTSNFRRWLAWDLYVLLRGVLLFLCWIRVSWPAGCCFAEFKRLWSEMAQMEGPAELRSEKGRFAPPSMLTHILHPLLGKRGKISTVL